MLLWAFLSFITFIVIIRIVKAVLSNDEPELGDATLSAEMQKEIAEALREKYAATNLVIKESELGGNAEKTERIITFEVKQLDEIESATDAVLRDLLRWFNQLGLACGRAVVSPAIHQELIERFSSSFDSKIRKHKRVQEMEQMGCSIILETTDSFQSEDDKSE